MMGRAAESGCKRCTSDWSGASCRARVEWIVDGSPCKSIRKEDVKARNGWCSWLSVLNPAKQQDESRPKETPAWTWTCLQDGVCM